MPLTIKMVDNIIQEVFDKSLVHSIDSTYEKGDGDFYKLVISIHHLVFEETIVLHTKFIFKTNLEKTGLIEDSFYYLYDLNCVYKKMNYEMDNDESLRDKLHSIIDMNMFGKDIQNLSEFMLSPASRINNYLAQKEVEKFSVFVVNYNPKFKMMPCEEMSFDFDININDILDVKLNIDKIEKNDYKLTFKYLETITHEYIGGLNNIAEVIAMNLIKNVNI